MKKTSVAVAIALLAAGWAMPSYAQMPSINLMQDTPSKTPEEKETEEARDKAYKDTLKKIPDAKTTSDPWGGVRAADTPKAPAKTAAAKTSAKKSKTSANAN